MCLENSKPPLYNAIMIEKTKNPHAIELGKLGGQKVKDRGSRYFADLQAKRKERKGGRPKNPPQAPYEGVLPLAGRDIYCAVLEDGTRLLSQGTFLRAIGRSRTPKAGTGGLRAADRLPFFLQAEQLKPFISSELETSAKPLIFRMKNGQQVVGYRAELLPQVCDVYLKFRDACRKEGRDVPRQYQHIVEACDMLMRGLAHVGIVALVDEATGYQDVRAREALAKILDDFIATEFRKWMKRFPDEFYKQLFRLRRWRYPPNPQKPPLVGKLTIDLVYDRLAPGVRKELEKRNPKNEHGRRKRRHHQYLTEDIGHPKLQEHLSALIALMKVADSWEQFKRMVNTALPRYPDMPLLDAPDARGREVE